MCHRSLQISHVLKWTSGRCQARRNRKHNMSTHNMLLLENNINTFWLKKKKQQQKKPHITLSIIHVDTSGHFLFSITCSFLCFWKQWFLFLVRSTSPWWSIPGRPTRYMKVLDAKLTKFIFWTLCVSGPTGSNIISPSKQISRASEESPSHYLTNEILL